MYLVAGSTFDYWERARPYLDSLSLHLNSEIQPLIFAVDWPDGEGVYRPGTTTVYIDADDLTGATELQSIQHGAFLPFVPGTDDDVIIYTDCDMELQRSLSDDELDTLRNLSPGVWFAGMNAGYYDTLMAEASRLHTPLPAAALAELFPNYSLVPCANCGLIAARRSAWEAIHREYMARYHIADVVFPHPSRCQWLINYAAYAAGLKMERMTARWHCHFHFGTPPGVRREYGQVTYLSAPVLWTHKAERFTQERITA